MRGLWLLSMFALAAACQPIKKNAGDVKSLENFTRGADEDVKLNRCGMDLESLAAAPLAQKQQLARILAHTDELKRETLSALTAVPEAMAKPFFAAGGTIEVIPNAEDTCAEIPLTKAEKQFAGENRKGVKTCWRQHAPGRAPVIYVEAKPATIRHALVRSFAFLYGELFMARLNAMATKKGELDANTQAAIRDYMRRTMRVGDALLKDVKAKDPKVSLRLETYKQTDADQYHRIAAAEALDSYFCSPATQLAFRQGFPLTYRAFAGKQDGLAPVFGTPWFQ